MTHRSRSPKQPRHHARLLLCCALSVVWLLAERPAHGQGESIAGLLPVIGAVGEATVAQVSNDGQRARVVVGRVDGPVEAVLVADTRTGALLFDSRLETSPDFSDAYMTPDGSALVYGVATASSRSVRVRTLADAGDRQLFEGPAALRLQAADRTAAHVAYVLDLPDAAPAVAVWSATGTRTFGVPCRGAGDALLEEAPRLSDDGLTLAYLARRATAGVADTPARYDLVHGDVQRGLATCVAPTAPTLGDAIIRGRVALSGEGIWAGVTLQGTQGGPHAALVALRSGVAVPVPDVTGPSEMIDLSTDARTVLVYPLADQGATSVRVIDRRTMLMTAVRGFGVGGYVEPPLRTARLSGDGRSVTVSTTGSGGLAARHLIARLDLDGDGMPDTWESWFGLNPQDPADGPADADGDGVSSWAEYHRSSHPRGVPVRYLAEGAASHFFDATIALYNPTASAGRVNLRFVSPEGEVAAVPVYVAAGDVAYHEVHEWPLPFPEFSVMVEAAMPVIAERRMTWDRSRRYGSHAEAGVEAPSTTWHFAEGATIGGMQTFFLLQNPADVPVVATLRYRLSSGVLATRDHPVPAHTRVTVWVNQEGAPLDAAEFATEVVATGPIVAERALYRDVPGQPFGAGSAAAGAPSPSTSWLFAEGATGDFFDTFLLIANQNDAPATVVVRYVRAGDGGTRPSPITRTYTVSARSRFTVWVAQEDPGLRSTAVSMILEADRPVIAERTMWWPGPTAATWREVHTTLGATGGAVRWATADTAMGCDADDPQAFLLLTPTEPRSGVVRIRLSCARGYRRTYDMPLPPERTTIWLNTLRDLQWPGRCAADVESLPVRVSNTPGSQLLRVPFIMEKAQYGRGFEWGSVALATPIPLP